MGDIYTFAAAVTEITLALGNRSDLGTRPTDWLNAAQLDLAKCPIDLPQLEKTLTGFNTVANTSEYNLLAAPFPNPSDIIGIRFIRNDTTGLGMWRMNWDDYRRLTTQAVADPVRWARKGYTLALDPQPNGVDALRFDYRRRPQLGVIEVDGEWQNVLVDIATWYGARRIRLDDVAKMAIASIPQSVLLYLQRPLSQDDLEMMWSEPSLMPGYGPVLIASGGSY